MTVDDVRKRLDALQKDREHLKYQLAGYDGAIQDCEWFLERVQAEATTPNADEEAPNGPDPSAS